MPPKKKALPELNKRREKAPAQAKPPVQKKRAPSYDDESPSEDSRDESPSRNIQLNKKQPPAKTQVKTQAKAPPKRQQYSDEDSRDNDSYGDQDSDRTPSDRSTPDPPKKNIPV